MKYARIFLIACAFAIGASAQDKPASPVVFKPIATTLPQVVYKIEAKYTPEARKRNIQGKVLLHLVVDADGMPTFVRVVKSLDPGLDQNAIEAVKQWRFRPATEDGQPVSSEAQVDVSFILLSEPPKHGDPQIKERTVAVAIPQVKDEKPTLLAAPQIKDEKRVVVPIEAADTSPELISKVEPKYTDEAHKKEIQGKVLVYAIVNKDGIPTALHILKSLDPGLDQNAMDAVKQWRFRPATKAGQPVAVEAQVEVNFALMKQPPKRGDPKIKETKKQTLVAPQIKDETQIVPTESKGQPQMTKPELIDKEIEFIREQLKFLRRTSNAIDRQIDVLETRIDDLRKEQRDVSQ
jgi:TonB family protein